MRGTFKDSYVPTIEDTYRQVITSNKMVCTLQITDTTGSHQFPAMQRLNIQKGHAFILVYSITSRQSLEELKAIYKDIKEIKGASEMKNVPMMLVGSKCDETSREVPAAVIEKLAQDWNCAHIETSAKNNLNVKEAFQQLLSMDTRYNMSLDSNGKNNSDKLSSQSSLAKNAVKPKNKKAKGDKNSGDQPNEPAKRKCIVM